MKLKKNEYQCDHCKGVFVKGWSDEEAEKESEQWGDELEKQGRAIICDDCYKDFMNWAEDKKVLKN